jgi:hypothetical protein
VVLKKGQAARHASVAPDLTPEHYQRPPPPRFDAVPSILGKRRLDYANGTALSYDARGGPKRSRVAEIAETQEDEVMASVEKSPELIADTQTSPLDNRRPLVKTESPGLSRRLHDIAPATLDELEYLPEEPPNFHLHARATALQRNRMAPHVNGVPQDAAARAKNTYASTQLPITPPTDPRSAPQTLKTTSVNGHAHPPATSEPKNSSHLNKFKSGRADLYDLPDSDIEDSQMPGPDKVDLSSHFFGNHPAGQHHQSSFPSYNALPDLPPIELDSDADATQAFIAGKRHSVSLHNNFGGRALKPPPAQANSGEELEIPATASDPKESLPTQSRAKSGQSYPPHPILPEQGPGSSDSDSTDQSRKSEKDRRKRRRSKKRGSQSSDGDVVTSDDEDSQDLDQTSASRRTSTTNNPSRRSSALDSPGEQLSQALQASAKKPSAPTPNSNLSNQVSASSSSGTGSAPSSRRTSSGSSGSSGRLGLGITDSPRKKKPSPPEKAPPQPKSAPQKVIATSKATSTQTTDKKGKKTTNGKAKKNSPVGEVLDLDKQCGVIDAKTGKPCERAIQNTCHSKGLKRAISGRSLPLDDILEKIKNGDTTAHVPVTTKASTVKPADESRKTEAKTANKAGPVSAVLPTSKAFTPPPQNRQAEVAPQVVWTASPNLILPKGMTAEQFKELRKYNSEHPQPKKPKATDARKATATPDVGLTGSMKKPAPKSKSKSKSATPAPTPAQPSGKSVKSVIPAASAPVPLESALKNSTSASSSSDRRSSASSSGSSRNIDDLFKNVVAKNAEGTQPASAILEYAGRNTDTGKTTTKKSSTEPKQQKAAPKSGLGTTRSVASTSKATPAPLTSSASSRPAITPTPAAPAVPNLLKNLKNQMRAKRARDSAKASPAPGVGSNMSNPGTKTLFGIEDEESSEGSSDEESDSEKENEEPAKSAALPKAGDEKNGAAKAVSEGSGSSEASESEEDDEEEEEQDDDGEDDDEDGDSNDSDG